jgi:malonyl-CoA/methylmalonyl-CoA synthetase
VLSTAVGHKPEHLELAKHKEDASRRSEITWEEAGPGGAGLMLYTSGTTNRPVGNRQLLHAGSLKNTF